MNRTRSSKLAALPLAAVLLTVAGCASTQSPDRAEVEIKGSSRGTAPAAPTAVVGSAPSASGVVIYDGYQAAVARSGDTVATVARRIGLSASELGAYNGLSPTHPLRQGDELVLPQRPDNYAALTAVPAVPAAPPVPQSGVRVAGIDPAATQIEAVPLDSSGAAAGTAANAGAVWSPDIAAAAIERSDGLDARGNLTAPPSTAEPLPPDPQPPVELASPQLRQYQTPAPDQAAPAPEPLPVEPVIEDNTAVELAAAAPVPQPTGDISLTRPVAGPIVTRYNQNTGRVRNDGIAFAAPSGSPVVAAADGEIALVSQSLGGLGTIVLVRHLADYLTVYGRIDNVTVKKGDIISRGQQIGVVSQSPQPRMHFELRKGAESMDPEAFF